jgi:hypothetical protein
MAIIMQAAVNTRSIKALVDACETFETQIEAPCKVLPYSLEQDLRAAFERIAREELGGLALNDHELSKKLAKCDTVEEMKAALTLAAGGDVAGKRQMELLQEVRFDNEKLFGAFHYKKIVENLQAAHGPMVLKKDGLAQAIRLTLEKKGVCLCSAPADGAPFGYRQKDALYNVGRLLVPDAADSLWQVLNNEQAAGFDKCFNTKTTVYKNGNIVIKGMGLRNVMLLSELLAAKYLQFFKEA